MRKKRTSFKQLLFPLFFFILVAVFVQSQEGGIFKPGELTTDCTPCTQGDSNDCDNLDILKTCVYDDSSCPTPGYYLSQSTCSFGQSCSEGQCRYRLRYNTECIDECESANSKECVGVVNGYRVCGQFDADGCLDWSTPPAPCQTGLTCIDGNCATNVCTTDPDCGSARYCSPGGLCRYKKPNGQECSRSTECTTSYCNPTTGTCRPQPAETCTTDAQCASNLCDTTTTTCIVTKKANGGTCTRAAECTSNTCTAGTCQVSSSTCTKDGDCGATCGGTSYCNQGTCTPRKAIGQDCTTNHQCIREDSCINGRCNALSATNLRYEESCSVNEECSSGNCIGCVCQGITCETSTDCTTPEETCDIVTKTCTPLRSADTDGDGLLNGNDPDVDGDGLLNGNDPDTDGDGLLNGNDPDVDGNPPIPPVDLPLGQNRPADTDQDGVPDDVEIARGTDPNNINSYPQLINPDLDLNRLNAELCPLPLDDNIRDRDNVFCDLCPDLVGTPETNGCPLITLADGTTTGIVPSLFEGTNGYDLDSCLGLGGFTCSTETSCTEGGGTVLGFAKDQACCVSTTPATPAACSESIFSPTLSTTTTLLRSGCTDPDGDGTGTQTITVNGLPATATDVASLGGAASIIPECGTQTCTQRGTTNVWDTSCTILPPGGNKVAVPFFGFLSVFMSVIFLSAFYLTRKRKL